MVLKGPSAYDAVFGYESVAIDYLKSAAGRWGELQLARLVAAGEVTIWKVSFLS